MRQCHTKWLGHSSWHTVTPLSIFIMSASWLLLLLSSLKNDHSGNAWDPTTQYTPAFGAVCPIGVTKKRKGNHPLSGIWSRKPQVELIHSFPVNTRDQKRSKRMLFLPLFLHSEKRDVTASKSQFRLRTWSKYNPFFRQKPSY